jgi:uncharacterized RDD family membrane protein YckC
MAFNFTCPQCGATISAPDSAAGQPGTCNFCHAQIVAPALPEVLCQPVPAPSQPIELARADIGRRGVAWLIDYAIICAVVLPLNLALGFTHVVTTAYSTGASRVFLPTDAPGWIIGAVITLLYGTLMESSGWRATLGKRLLGMQVLDTSCHTLTRKKALLRNFVKGITAPVSCCAWMYAVAVFSPRNQALHDIAADTLVLDRA